MIYDIETVQRDDATFAESKTGALVESFKGLAESFVITTERELDGAKELFDQASALRMVIEDLTEPFRKEAYRHYKFTQTTKKNLLEPLDEAIEMLRGHVVAFYEGNANKLLAMVVESGDNEVDPAEIEPVVDAMNAVDERFDLRKYHKANVTDIEALIGFVVRENRYDLVEPNQTALNGMARRMGDSLGIDGVEVITRTTPVPKNG